MKAIPGWRDREGPAKLGGGGAGSALRDVFAEGKAQEAQDMTLKTGSFSKKHFYL